MAKITTQNSVQIRVNETTWGRLANDPLLANLTSARMFEVLAYSWAELDSTGKRAMLLKAKRNFHRLPMRKRIHADVTTSRVASP